VSDLCAVALADGKAVVATLAHSAHVDNGFQVERMPGC
jgi:chaperone required for assembly of F1-ATPase